MGVFELPYGLQHKILLINESISLRNDIAHANTVTFDGFVKERGEFATQNKIFHFELISFIFNDNVIPIIIKIWGVNKFSAQEYLISKGIISFRSMILNNLVTISTLNMLSFHIGIEHPGDTISPLSNWILGGSFEDQYLIPNFNIYEYDRFINELSLTFHHPHTDAIVEEFVKYAYDDTFTPMDVYQLIGMIDNKIPPKRTYEYQVEDSYVLGCHNLQMTIESFREHSAIMIISRIVFDEFYIILGLDKNQVDILSCNSSAGPFLPFNVNFIFNDIVFLLNEFTNMYFYVDSSNDTVRYVDSNGLVIDRIEINRTNNEILLLTIISGEFVYMKQYDLLLLSIMSPMLQ